jgi:hypothetical protein
MQKIIGMRPASVVTSQHALVCCCLYVVDSILCKNYTWLDVITDRHIQVPEPYLYPLPSHLSFPHSPCSL